MKKEKEKEGYSTSTKVGVAYFLICFLGIGLFLVAIGTSSPNLAGFSALFMGIGLYALYVFVRNRRKIVVYDEDGDPIDTPYTKKVPEPKRPISFFEISAWSNLYLYDLHWEVYRFMKRWLFVLPVAMTCGTAAFYIFVFGIYHAMFWVIVCVCTLGFFFLCLNEYLTIRKFWYESVILAIFTWVLIGFIRMWWFSPDYVILPKNTIIYNQYGKKSMETYGDIIKNSKITMDVKVKVVRGGVLESGDPVWEVNLLDEGGLAIGPRVFVLKSKAQEIDEDPASSENSGFRTFKFTAGDTTRTDINGDPIVFNKNDSWVIDEQQGSFHLWGNASPVLGTEPRTTITGGPFVAIGITNGTARMKIIRAKS